jgi:hypothetical protein
MNIKNLVAVAALCLGATSVHAAPVAPNGTFAGSQNGTINTTYTTGGSNWKLGSTTTAITVPNGGHNLVSYTDPYLSNPNNLIDTHGGSISASTLDNLNNISFTLSNNVFNSSYAVGSGFHTLGAPLTLTVATYTFTFLSEQITSKTNGNVAILFLGNLTADTAGHLITPAAASFSVSATSSAQLGAVGASYSINTPPDVVNVPEPGSLALLGLGMAALVAARKKKAA